ncbi:DUF4291 family protein [Paractinoplanes globisporus]|uniref:DUF4291 family protein n=1 Tax=Paractinoplanes globisporus TaxID=113565 RepID=A0ABW6WPE5_9ACTN
MREAVEQYVDEWTVAITDVTPTVRQVRDLLTACNHLAATAHLPAEHADPPPDRLRNQISASPNHPATATSNATQRALSAADQCASRRLCLVAWSTRVACSR